VPLCKVCPYIAVNHFEKTLSKPIKISLNDRGFYIIKTENKKQISVLKFFVE
tara:strand:- start:429 stop:584 length:156 start_codon:yes stop_codon:yes gene_type:complete